MFDNLWPGLLICIFTIGTCAETKQNSESLNSTPTAQLTVQENKPENSQNNASKGAEEEKVYVFLGDSLTAGAGVALKDTYPSIIQSTWQEMGLNYRVINAGISGDTTTGVLNRLDWVFPKDSDADVVILGIGGNDAMRGTNLEVSKENLEKIIETIQAKGIQLVLMEMKMPANYGKEFNHTFSKMYQNLAQEYSIPLFPFNDSILEQIDLFQKDGIHPTAEGHQIIAENIIDFLTEKDLS